MAKKWSEVESDPKYQGASEGQKQAVAEGFFNDVIKPDIPEGTDVNKIKTDFMARAIPPKPGIIDRISSGLSDLVTPRTVVNPKQTAKLSTFKQDPQSVDRLLPSVARNRVKDGQARATGQLVQQGYEPREAAEVAIGTDNARIDKLNKEATKPVDMSYAEPMREKPKRSLANYFQDTAGSVVKIPGAVVRDVANIGNMLTGDSMPTDVAGTMQRGMQEFDRRYGSDAKNFENEEFNRIASNPDQDFTSQVDYLLQNPSFLADQGITTVGSMFIPAGASAGALKVADKLFKGNVPDVVARALRNTSVAGTVAMQNAAETFNDPKMQDVPLDLRYEAAGITALGTLLGNKIFGGGVEKAIADKFNKSGAAQGMALAAREGGQEAFESLSQSSGKAFALPGEVSLNQALGGALMEGAMGAVMGGGVAAVGMSGAGRQDEATPSAKPKTKGQRIIDFLKSKQGTTQQTQEVSGNATTPQQQPQVTPASEAIAASDLLEDGLDDVSDESLTSALNGEANDGTLEQPVTQVATQGGQETPSYTQSGAGNELSGTGPAGLGADADASTPSMRRDIPNGTQTRPGDDAGNAAAGSNVEQLPTTEQFSAVGTTGTSTDTSLNNDLDTKANEAATSTLNDLSEPTEAQREAGNYKVGRIKVGGLNISVENPDQSQRKGTDRDGNEWQSTMNGHHGYVKGVKARAPDKEHVDVNVKPGTAEDYAGDVFVINQNDPKTGKFDEPKAYIGYANESEAEGAYRSNYADDWKGFGDVVRMPMAKFKEMLGNEKAFLKPVKQSKAKPRQKAPKVHTLLTALDSLGGLDTKYKWDISGEKKFARGGYNRIFKNASTKTLEEHIKNGNLDEFLPYEMRSSATDDPTEGRNYLADKIRNAKRVIPYDEQLAIDEELRQNRISEAEIDDIANRHDAGMFIDDNDDIGFGIGVELTPEESEAYWGAVDERHDNAADGGQTQQPIAGGSQGSGISGNAEAQANEESQRTSTQAQNEVAGNTGSQRESAEREGVRPIVEAIVRRRAAANEIGKLKAFDDYLGAAKDFLNGKDIKPTRFKLAASTFKQDPQLSEAYSQLAELAKAPAKEGRANTSSIIEQFNQRIDQATTAEQLRDIAREIQQSDLSDAKAEELDDKTMDKLDALDNKQSTKASQAQVDESLSEGKDNEPAKRAATIEPKVDNESRPAARTFLEPLFLEPTFYGVTEGRPQTQVRKEARAKAERDRKDAKRRAEAQAGNVDNFVMGESSRDAAKPQNDMFGGNNNTVTMPAQGSVDANDTSPKSVDETQNNRQGKEPSEDAKIHAKELGGRVVWHEGDIALIEGYSMISGNSVYIPAKGSRRAMMDIEGYRGNEFTADEIAKLKAAKQIEVDKANAEIAKNPNGVFGNESLVFADDIPQSIRNTAQGWINQLALENNRIVITSPESGAEMAKNQYGRFKRIGKAQLGGNETFGTMQPLGDGDYHIAIRLNQSPLKLLEVLAHELGHIVEKEAFKNAPDHLQVKIREEHKAWLEKQKSGLAIDMATNMRAYRSGRGGSGFGKNTKADGASYYWKSFSEWFADQTARWATTQEKPLSVVDNFFKRLADKLRTFFVGEKAKFLPNSTVSEWLNSLSPDIPLANNQPIEQGSQGNNKIVEPIKPIEDFGEKIGGAKKDLWSGFKGKMEQSMNEAVASVPLSKSWPEPDYQALIDGGVDRGIVDYIRALRDYIPTKPKMPSKVKRWANQVEIYRNIAYSLIEAGGMTKDIQGLLLDVEKSMRNPSEIKDLSNLYFAVGHEQSLKGISVDVGTYSLYQGVEYKPSKTIWSVGRGFYDAIATGDTKEEAVSNFAKAWGKRKVAELAKRQTTFEIYSYKSKKGKWFIGKKVGKNTIDLKEFDDLKDARAYKNDPKNQETLEALLAKAKEIPNERNENNSPRVGADHRNGENITQQAFGEAFGFRGIEFGNYVQNDKRQQDLNEAYDALMDMAGVLNIPAKAISLNGELGIAFGARGSGGKRPAKAHYEPGHVVINLTKNKGAGSLGHEWWHALDNYFSRMRNKGGDYTTEAGDVNLASYGVTEGRPQTQVRKEMIDAFGGIVKALTGTKMKERSRQLDKVRTKDYWTTGREMAARAFESYLIAKLQDQNASNDYLANIVTEEVWGREASYPYPTAGEIAEVRAAYDNFFNAVQTKETDNGNVALNQDKAQYTPYDTDIFGNALPSGTTGTAENANPARALSSAEADYYASTIVGTTTKKRLTAPLIRSAKELAQATQYLNKSAVERFDGIVTDANGKPLAVIGGFKGEITSVTTPKSTIIAEAMAVDGAKHLWLSHNHPNGVSELSEADINLYNYIKDMLDGSGVEVKGVIALSSKKFSSYGQNLDYDVTIPPAGVGRTVSVIEREIVDERIAPVSITDPQSAKDLAIKLRAKSQSSGIILLDAKSAPLAWVPVTDLMTGKLKNTGGLAQIYKAVSKANAVSAIIVHDGDLNADVNGYGTAASKNIAKALDNAGVRVLDVVDVTKTKTANERGDSLMASVVFSRNNAPPLDAIKGLKSQQQQKVVAIQALVDTITKGWANAPQVQVVFDMSDERIPEPVRRENDRQLSQGAQGQPEGFFTNGKAFIVATEMKSIEDVSRVLFHEVLGHYGLRGLYGPELKKVLNLVSIGHKSAVAKKATKYGLDMSVEKDRLIAAEEVLAELAQSKPELKLVQRAIAAIRTWLRENVAYFKDLALTDDEIIRNYLMPARSFVERGGKSQTVNGMVSAFNRASEFSSQVDEVISGSSKGALTLGKTPESLIAAGIPDTKMMVTQSTIDKVLYDHGIPVKTIKALPSLLSKPVMVFNSATQDGKFVVQLDAYKAGSPIVAIIKPNGNVERVSPVNVLASAYAKPAGVVSKWIESGLLIGADKQKALEFATTNGLQLPAVVQQINKSLDVTVINNDASVNGDIDGGSDSTLFSRQMPLQPGWQTLEESGHLKDVQYKLQDKHADMKDVIKAIKAAGRTVTDHFNPYLQEELYHGRVAKRVQDFTKAELEPLLKAMNDSGVTMADFEHYLWARHAEERNAQIAKINPDMPDGGSGLTNKEASDYLAQIPAKDKAAYEKLAWQVDAINARSRNLLVEYGIEDMDTAAKMEEAYKYYVPLMRDEMEKGHGSGTGQGFSIKGNSTKRAMGSTKDVVDILANIAAQREKFIVRGEKNRVATALVGLAKLNPNDEFWKVDKPPVLRYISQATGLVEEMTDPSYKSRDNVVVARILDKNGRVQERSVVFNEYDKRAQRMAESFKNLDVDGMEEWMSNLAKGTRYFASVNTQYNPLFGAINITRDIQAGALNLESTKLAGMQKEVIGQTFNAWKGIYRDLRLDRKGKKATGHWSELWEDYQNEGGQTGYRELFRTAKDRTDELNKIVDPDWWKKKGWGKIVSLNSDMVANAEALAADKVGKPIFQWLDDYNASLENSVRLAAYKAGLDKGLSKQEAASIAKNLTVNFNRKGASGARIGSLCAFFNASVQGTARISETMIKDGKVSLVGKKILTGGILLGVLQALALAGFDDEEPPQFERDRNLIIPVGGSKYVKIPMPLGFHVIPATARIVTEYALRGADNTPEMITHLAELFADAFNPVGGSGSFAQILSPTVSDPILDLTINEDFAGRTIAQKDFNSLDPTPGFTRARDTASRVSTVLSEILNKVTGGTDYQPGILSPTPDQIDYLAGQMFGGVGREVLKIDSTARAMVEGTDLPAYKVPLLGKFYGDAGSQSSEGRKFYSNIEKMNGHENEIKGRLQDGKDVQPYIDDKPEAKLWRQSKLTFKVVKKLRDRRDYLLQSGAPKADVEDVNTMITARMRSFNELVDSAKK